MADERWLAEVRAWIAGAIGADPELDVTRERAWGTIVRVTTAERVLFFKEPAPAGRQESVIVSDIAERWPGFTPDVIAADHERGWLLMDDHGAPMRESLDADAQVAIFEHLLPRYAEMQRASRGLVDRWMAAGAPDRRVERIPSLLDELIEGRSRIGTIAIDRGVIELLRNDLVAVGASLGPTAGIDHSDMHEGNVLVGRGTPRLIDWGDACITHPFASLFVIYQHVVARSDAVGRRRVALRLRDAYLEPWSDEGSADELRVDFARATWLGYVIRALNFVHMMGEADFDTCRKDVAQFLTRCAEKSALLDDPDELVCAVADQTEY